MVIVIVVVCVMVSDGVSGKMVPVVLVVMMVMLVGTPMTEGQVGPGCWG